MVLLEILREYERKDSRIIVIDKRNTRAGDSRNKGLEIVKGEYVTFFDSDDYYSNIEALKVMHQNIIQNNADITICRSSRFKQKSKLVKEQKWSIKKELFECKNIFNPKDYSKYIFQAFVGWPWDKLYRRELLLKNGLKYQNIEHSNDTFFVLFSLCLAEKISITEDNLVMHRMHKTSVAATREKRPKCFYKALTHLKYIANSLHFR